MAGDEGTPKPARSRPSQGYGSQAIVQQTPSQGASDASTAKVLGKRRHVDFIQATSTSDGKKLRVLSSATRVYILPDKLTSDEVNTIRGLVTKLGGMNASMAFANVILTTLQSPKRVLRQLDEDTVQRGVPVLHASWLYDSASAEILQPYDGYQVYPEPAPAGDSQSGPLDKTSVQPQMRSEHAAVGVEEAHSSRASSATEYETDYSSNHTDSVEYDFLAPRVPGQEREDAVGQPPWQNSEYACLRPTPLRSRHNQDLAEALETLRLQRVLAEKSPYHATAYGRAISAVKAYPHSLAPNPANAKNLKGVGKKIAKLIEQYYQDGSITEVQTIRTDDAFRRMTSFMELYGIGPKTARELYSDGARSFEDVIRMARSIATHLNIDDCLRILPDLQTKIPRAEVEEIAQFIQDTLETIKKGCVHTICGGYRRGKSLSSDVDIVIADTQPQQGDRQMDLFMELLTALQRRAFTTHTINTSTPNNKFEETFSRLDIAEVVVLPPASKTVPKPRFRRVDIIMGPHKTHGAAVLGWTGSRQFERDLRLLARRKGYKFHSSGLTPTGESEPLHTPSEEDIFEKLGIPFMPPHLRNCDV